jgi:hypothetical protein
MLSGEKATAQNCNGYLVMFPTAGVKKSSAVDALKEKENMVIFARQGNSHKNVTNLGHRVEMIGCHS